MKPSVIALLTGALITASASAQGPLTPPPGAPAPVMKSLDQIEARTPVSSLPGDATAQHIISQPGSYYLTASLVGVSGKSGIRIAAANVTLDLNGFTLQGVGGSATGISISVAGGPVSIRNGFLSSWVTGGIFGETATHVSLADLTISAISAGPGVYVGNHSTATRVTVKAAQRAGIHLGGASGAGIVDHCTVENLGGANATLLPNMTAVFAIIASVISDSTAIGFNSALPAETVYGIYADTIDRCRVSDMSFGDTNGMGICGGIVRNSHVQNLSGTATDICGISGINIEGNTVIDVNGADRCGIQSAGYGARIIGNSLMRSKLRIGSNCDATGNRIYVDNNQDALIVDFGGGSRICNNTITTGTGSTARAILVNSVGNLVENNEITVGNSATGIMVAAAKNTIRNNTVRTGTSSAGIRIGASVTACRIDGNNLSQSDSSPGIAMDPTATKNIIFRNTVTGSASPYSISAGNQVGTIATGALDTSVSPWANLSLP